MMAIKGTSLKHLLSWTIAAVVLALFLLGRFSDIIVDWLWFTQMNYGQIFTRILLLKVSLAALAGAVAFLFLGFNLQVAFRRALTTELLAEDNVIEVFPGERIRVPSLLLQWGAWLLAAFIAMPFMLHFADQWDVA